MFFFNKHNTYVPNKTQFMIGIVYLKKLKCIRYLLIDIYVPRYLFYKELLLPNNKKQYLSFIQILARD